MTKKKATSTGRRHLTCPNPSCGKVFANPLKARNLVTKDVEPYDACPYCLTKISIEGASSVAEAKLVSAQREIETKAEAVRTVRDEITVREPKAECAHYLGYLSGRSSKDKIPEECIICDDVVKCMLKAVKD